MRGLKLLIFIGVCLVAESGFAQRLSSKAIEADLLKSFRKIDYWSERRHDTTDAMLAWDDSLKKANNVFGEKLKYYTSNFPQTINYPFNLLQKENLHVVQSTDGLLKIYDWDTWLGGTMHDFRNVKQYKSGSKVYSILELDTASTNDDHYVYFYTNLYTFKTHGKTYYLAVYGGIFSTVDAEAGIRVFTIEDSELKDVPLVKTESGLHKDLYYYYNLFSVIDWKVNGKVVDWKHRPKPFFDEIDKSIRLPLVTEKGIVTRKFITYKFTGKYFERVK